MQGNQSLSVEEKQHLTKRLHPYKILQNVERSVQKQPYEFVRFLRDKARNVHGIDEAEYLMEIIETAIQACPAKDDKTLPALQGLQSKLYLAIENFSAAQRQKPSTLKKQKEHKENQYEDKAVRVSSRKKAHHILLQTKQPALTDLEAGDLFKLGEDLLMPMAKSYLDATEGKATSPHSPILMDIIAGSFDMHHAFRKGLQYLIEALKQTQDAEEGTAAHEIFTHVRTLFLPFLGLNEEKRIHLSSK